MTDRIDVPGENNEIVGEELSNSTASQHRRELDLIASNQSDTQREKGGEEGSGRAPVSTLTPRMLDLLRGIARFWPNMSRACAMIGIPYSVYQSWLTNSEFCACIEDIKRTVLDDLEGLGAEFARTPKGFMHWIATLRAHRPERWNQDKQVTIRQELGREALRAKSENLARVIALDATIIESTTGQSVPQVPEVKTDPDAAPHIDFDAAFVARPSQSEDLERDKAAAPGQEAPLNPQDIPGHPDILDPTDGAVDGLPGLDIPAEEGYALGVIDSPPVLNAKRSARKNQQGDTSTPTPPPFPPSKKQKRSKRGYSK